ncbi:MAG TPA: hypothetical protein VGD65_01265 [Chryseosolibacter sp.]
MAKASLEIITILRNTTRAIAASNDYQWGHMGACNCGFLAQEVTHLQKSEIHARAMRGTGDWNEQLNDYCPTSGLPMDDLITNLLMAGFDIDDLKHLERLSSREILQTIPIMERNLKQNSKGDVVKYLEAWTSLLEMKLLEKIPLYKMISAKMLTEV